VLRDCHLSPDTEFEAITELEFDQTADLDCEANHDPLMHAADVGPEPNPDLEFGQTLGW